MPDCSKRDIMKFGSSLLKSPKDFESLADFLIEQKKNRELIIVLSAMQDMTDHLIGLAHQVHDKPPKREYDMLVSSGERISIALLAMALKKRGVKAESFTGSQSGILTNSQHQKAQIIDVQPYRIEQSLQKSNLVIVAGFQGVSRHREITTLGRGGSDVTAVALALALSAEKVEFYKDVEGVADKDPNRYKKVKFFSSLSYEEALKIMAKSEHSLIHPRAILLAEKNQLVIEVKSPYNDRVTTIAEKFRKPTTKRYESLLPLYQDFI